MTNMLEMRMNDNEVIQYAIHPVINKHMTEDQRQKLGELMEESAKIMVDVLVDNKEKIDNDL